MNCPNCGAAMRLVTGRDYLVCDYCTTFHFANAVPESVDGVTDRGPVSDLLCPVCRSALRTGAVSGNRVQYCAQCRGILASNPAFAAIVEIRRAQRREPPRPPQPLDPRELERHISCPACGEPMDVHPYYGPGAVVLDSCARCTLIWLDHGEIAAIERAPGRT